MNKIFIISFFILLNIFDSFGQVRKESNTPSYLDFHFSESVELPYGKRSYAPRFIGATEDNVYLLCTKYKKHIITTNKKTVEKSIRVYDKKTMKEKGHVVIYNRTEFEKKNKKKGIIYDGSHFNMTDDGILVINTYDNVKRKKIEYKASKYDLNLKQVFKDKNLYSSSTKSGKREISYRGFSDIDNSFYVYTRKRRNKRNNKIIYNFYLFNPDGELLYKREFNSAIKEKSYGIQVEYHDSTKIILIAHSLQENETKSSRRRTVKKGGDYTPGKFVVLQKDTTIINDLTVNTDSLKGILGANLMYSSINDSFINFTTYVYPKKKEHKERIRENRKNDQKENLLDVYKIQIDLLENNKAIVQKLEANYVEFDSELKYDANKSELKYNKKLKKQQKKRGGYIPLKTFSPLYLFELENNYKYQLLENRYWVQHCYSTTNASGFSSTRCYYVYYTTDVLVHYINPNDSIVKTFTFYKSQSSTSGYDDPSVSFTPMVSKDNKLAIIYNSSYGKKTVIKAQEADPNTEKINIYELYSAFKDKKLKRKLVSCNPSRTYKTNSSNYYLEVDMRNKTMCMIQQNR